METGCGTGDEQEREGRAGRAGSVPRHADSCLASVFVVVVVVVVS